MPRTHPPYAAEYRRRIVELARGGRSITALARWPRYHIHYTPTYASWLNQVERWLGLITQHAIRRGSFRSVNELVQKIDAYVVSYNLHHRPFAWTATTDSILPKLQRLCKVISGTSH
jgi:putative transposase